MLEISTRLTLIVEMLCRAVVRFAARQARGPATVLLGARVYVEIARPSPHPPIAQEIWHLLIARTERIAARFAALVRRWQSGSLPKPRARPPAARSPAARPAAARAPYPRLPGARGWINRRIDAAAQAAALLEALLHWPDLPRLVEAAPQAGRLLRPLAHALGIPLPPYLQRPKRAAQPKRFSPPAKRGEPEGGRPPPTSYRPLQPYVRAAARAWKEKST